MKDIKRLILERLNETCRSLDLDDMGEVQWSDGQMIRKCALRAQRGELSGWNDFMTHVNSNRDVARGIIHMFRDLGWANDSAENNRMELTLPEDYPPIDNERNKSWLPC